ncbi:hypothetical protein VNI00_014977 [Paramarasmius palmivorus]|uniref:DNA polymerase n=1 Tax=Paramarasmius palmivorus TaxID=297713 RepID=A0AAW0BLY0_9AGAR
MLIHRALTSAHGHLPGCSKWGLTQLRRSSNDAIVDMLRRCKEAEDQSPVRNPYKIRSFQRAIQAIEGLKQPIEKPEDVQGLRGLGVGAGISKRIVEFLKGNDVAAPIDPKERREEDKKLLARLDLEKVPYIGPTAAQKLVDMGCKSIDELLKPKYFEELKPTQRIGARYYHHLQQPVQRQEAEAIASEKHYLPEVALLYAEASTFGPFAPWSTYSLSCSRRNYPIAPSAVILIQHSAPVHIPLPNVPPFAKAPEDATVDRRGRVHVAFRPTSGYSSRLETARDPLLGTIVPALEERGLLAEKIQSSAGRWIGIARVPDSADTKNGETEIHPFDVRRLRKEAISEGKGIFRKMELNLISEKSLGAALIALTGDVEFNRIIRLAAAKMGLLLNEFGLWKYNENSWELLPASNDEKEIFAELGMKYVEPERRNYSYLTKNGNRTRPATDVKPALKAY